MILSKKALLAGSAALTAFFGAAAQTTEAEAASPAIVAEVKTVTANYSTKSSRALAALEAQINAGKPAGTPRVVMVDTDQMSTFVHLNQNLHNFYEAMTFYIGDKTKLAVDPALAFNAAKAAVNGQTVALHPHHANPALSGKALENSTCVVIPYFPNQRALTHIHKNLTVVNPQTGTVTLPVTGKVVDPAITDTQMEQITNGREAFRCLDTDYTKKINRGANATETLMALHKAQVFSDTGGLLLAIRNGADPALAGKFAQYRAAHVGLTEPGRALTLQPNLPEFYGSATYSTWNALAQVQAQVEKMGVAKFRQMPLAAMVKMAKDITEQSSLTQKELTHVLAYMVQGEKYLETLKAKPEEHEAATRFLALRAKSVSDSMLAILREPTDAEKKDAPPLSPAMLTELLTVNILQNPEVQKAGSTTEAKLAARARLVDELREMMSSLPEKADFAHKLLQGVTSSDPLVRTKPEGGSKHQKPLISA